MKKVLAIFLCVLICVAYLPALATETEPAVILFDDFSEYSEGTVIPTKRWSRHVKNDTTKSSGKAYLEGDNMVCRFSIEAENTNSGPELVRNLDLTGMQDMTIACRAKQEGGTAPHILFYSDGVQNAVLAKTNAKEWTDIEVVFDFTQTPATYTTTVGNTTTTGTLGEIYDLTNCAVRFKQNIDSTKFAYWDDISITSYSYYKYTTKDESEWFAWTVPDEAKAKGTAIDASFLLEKPAGKHGFVQASGDSFVFTDGTPARFWGTNVVFNANNMSHEDSEILADRIARSGYNIVRLHMFDATREPNIFAPGTTRELDDEQLDNLFYFTAKLKERGIYIYMDLLVYRKAYASDGIEAVEDVDSKGWAVESHYDDYLLFLQQEYAEMLLSRTNPYTGLAYKDDPQMAMIGITNEVGLVYLMHDKSAYPQTEYYQNILNEKFNAWVHTKYASASELASAWAEDGKIGVMDDESYNDNIIRFPSEPNSATYSMARRQAHMDFLIDTEINFYSQMRDFLKNTVGVKCLCTGTALGGGGATKANLYANAVAGDYISRNAYYGTNASTLFNAQHMEIMASARVYGKPFIVTEWCAYEPMPYVAESKLLMSTYAQLQNWSMIHFQMWHENTLPGNQAAINTTFVEYQHPIRTALAPATSQNFMRGVTPFTTQYFYPKDYADGASVTSTKMPHFHNTGIYTKSGIMFENLIKNEAASDETALAAVESKRASADAANVTDQVYWNTNTADFCLETDYTQGVAGFRRSATELEYVTFDMDNTYYTAILNSMTHDTIPNSKRLLLSVGAGAHNTGREVADDYSNIVKSGTGPVLVEPVTGTVTLKLDREVEVYALTSSGERKEKLVTTTDAKGYTSFTLTNEQQTLNYEICSVGYTGGNASFVIENAKRTQSGAEFTFTNNGLKAGSTIVVAVAYNGNTPVDIKMQSVTLAANESKEISTAFSTTGYTKIRLFSIMDFFTMRIGARQEEI